MSDKKGEMQTGYNHNITHGGKTYHIQTEDCGVFKPFILTHVFLKGVVIDTLKESYADIMAEGREIKENVRELMKRQHLTMIKRTISGQYDGATEGEEPDEN